MARHDETPRDLLFGLLALQIGLIDQDQLLAAFSAWSRSKGKTLAEILLDRGSIDAESRSLLAAMADKQLKLHGGDTEKSLAAVATGPSTREKLAALGDTDLIASLALVGSHSPSEDATASMSVGTATSDGQRFRLLRPHARGGLGAVFVALDGELNREVALKQILDHHADDPLSRTRFLIEAEITGGLEHPGIVPVYGLGHYGDGRPYYAMRFIRGDSLKEAIASFHAEESLKHDPGKKSLALRKLLRRFVDVCNAIDYAHGRGVLHRDLKPGNVIVGRHGETLVVDWGLAKPMGHTEAGSNSDERTLVPASSIGSAETLPGMAIGTPAFMSPEQASGDIKRLGRPSDVYSLGATLYCLLTGKPPFKGTDLGAVLRDVQRGAFPRPCQVDPSIDPALEAVCLKAMATRPEDRHATARALADDVERWAADEPVSAWREPLGRRVRRWARRNRTAVAAAAAALLATLIGTAAILAVQTKANVELKEANNALSIANAKETKANVELKEANEALNIANAKAARANAELKEANEALNIANAKAARANADLTRANLDLAAAKDREAARFALAKDAVQLFHGQVGDDLVLKEDQFKPLRNKLLKGAAEFYGKLEKLLEGQNDPASRKSLGQAYYDLGDLTQKIGDKPQALEAHRKALAVRRELASRPDANDEARGDEATSQGAVGLLLFETGKSIEAFVLWKKSRDLLESLPPSGPGSEGRRNVLGKIDLGIGTVLARMGNTDEALKTYRKALAIQQELVDKNPADTTFRVDLARSYYAIGWSLGQASKTTEALESYQRALSIQQKLADDNPADTTPQSDLGLTLNCIGAELSNAGKTSEALESYRRALKIRQKLSDENPAVTAFRSDLAFSLHSVGAMLSGLDKPSEALETYYRALSIQQKLADDNPAAIDFRRRLAVTLSSIGWSLSRAGMSSEAMESFRQALAIQERLADDNPTDTTFRSSLAGSLNDIGIMLSNTDKPAEALKSYRRALKIRQKLADGSPFSARFRSMVAQSHNNIGVLLSELGQPAEALEAYRHALAIQQRLSDGNPANAGFRNSLALSLNNIGILQAQAGETSEAMEAYRRALAIRQRLFEDNPANTDFRSSLAGSHNDVGDLLAQLGRKAEAIEAHRQALAIRQALVDENPNVAEFQHYLAASMLSIGNLEFHEGKPDEAVKNLNRGQVIHEALAENNPTVPDYRNSLANCLSNIADVLIRLGRLSDGRGRCERAIALQEPLLRENGERLRYRLGLAESYLRLGQACHAEGNFVGAAAASKRGVALCQETSRQDGASAFVHACIRASLAQLAGKGGSGLSAEEGEVEASRAIGLLYQAVAMGFRNASLYHREITHDPIRSRPDFQLLMMDLAFPAKPFAR
jgi:eukaryotic-like serine/threonine-protein kinase